MDFIEKNITIVKENDTFIIDSITEYLNYFNYNDAIIIKMVFDQMNGIWINIYIHIFNFLYQTQDLDIIYKINKWNKYRILKNKDKVEDHIRQDIIISYNDILSQVKLLIPSINNKIDPKILKYGWKLAIKEMLYNSDLRTKSLTVNIRHTQKKTPSPPPPPPPPPKSFNSSKKNRKIIKTNPPPPPKSFNSSKKKRKLIKTTPPLPPSTNDIENPYTSFVYYAYNKDKLNKNVKYDLIYTLTNKCNDNNLIEILKSDKILPSNYNVNLKCDGKQYIYTNEEKGSGTNNKVLKIIDIDRKNFNKNMVIRIVKKLEFEYESTEQFKDRCMEEMSGLFFQKMLSQKNNNYYCDGVCEVYEFGIIEKNTTIITQEIPDVSVYAILEEVIPLTTFIEYYLDKYKKIDYSYVKIMMNILTEIIKVLKCFEKHNFINYDLKIENCGIVINGDIKLNKFDPIKSKITIKMYDLGNFANLSESINNTEIIKDNNILNNIINNYKTRINHKNGTSYYNTYSPIELLVFDIVDTINHSAGVGFILAQMFYFFKVSDSVLNKNDLLSRKITDLITKLIYPIILNKNDLYKFEITNKNALYSTMPSEFSKQQIFADINNNRISTNDALEQINDIINDIQKILS